MEYEVKSNRLRVLRVKSEDNLADIGTTAISTKIIRKHAISMSYIDAQEKLKTGGVNGAVDRGFRAGRSEQFSAAENVIGVNWWPCQSSSSSGSVGCEDIPCRGHKGDGVVTMNELQDMIDEGSISSTTVEVIKVLEMFDHDRKYSVWIGGYPVVIPQHISVVLDIKASWSVLQISASVGTQGRVVRQFRHTSGDRRADAE